MNLPFVVRLLPGDDLARSRSKWAMSCTPVPSAETTAESITERAGDRPIVVVGRRIHSSPAARTLVEKLAIDRPIGVVEMGWPSSWRPAGVQAFEYRSARCPDGGSNVALYAPQAFAETRPRNLTPWLCETTAAYVAFKHAQAPDQPRLFRWEQFLVQGRLPQPA